MRDIVLRILVQHNMKNKYYCNLVTSAPKIHAPPEMKPAAAWLTESASSRFRVDPDSCLAGGGLIRCKSSNVASCKLNLALRVACNKKKGIKQRRVCDNILHPTKLTFPLKPPCDSQPPPPRPLRSSSLCPPQRSRTPISWVGRPIR
jgi:hypothetical protein